MPARPQRVLTAVLLILGGFQAALAAGLPWGRASYGGGHRGVLPARLRKVSSFASVAYAVAAALTLSGAGTATRRTRALRVLAAFFGVGLLANGASRSPVERAVWTPVCAVGAVAAWRSQPRRSAL